MDHNGLYTDLDSFSSITNCGTTNNSFNDSCPTLPSLNNFKYQQTNLTGNIYQQPVQTVHDHQQQQQQQQHSHSAKSAPSSSLPQTQININNCNSNIFFPHDDGIFDANSANSTCASTTNLNSSGNSQKNNYIGYVRKEPGASGGGGDNITYNINNINTNIVNNINNPANLVSGGDVFGGNQYHQINKNGETIINFTNNNLNASMPADTVSATSQNYYGYQTNSAQGQQTVYETSVQSQSSTFLDPKSNMSTSGGGLYHHQSSHNQPMTNGGGSFLSGSASNDHLTPLDPFSEYSDPLSTAKILNNFESKNPLKYPPNGSRPAAAPYYKNTPEYQFSTVGHLPPHNYPGLYQPKHNYEPYPRMSRNSVPPHYQTHQHYAAPPSAHQIDEQAASRVNYNRPSPYHHPLPSNYSNYYGNGYSAMPYPAYSQMPGPPFAAPLLRSDSCSKSSNNFSKTGAVALSPVEHASFTMPSYSAPKKDFYNDNHYFPPHPPYYDDNALNSCAKKASSRPKANVDMYNPNGATTIYPDHHTMPPHHPANGNVIRHTNVAYQPMPKHYAPANAYPGGSCDITNPYFNYHYKNGEHAKMQKMSQPKQFKSFGHFETMPHPHYAHPPQYHTMQAKHPEKLKVSLDLEEQINSSKIPKMRDAPHLSYGFDPHHHHPYYQYHHHMPSRVDSMVDPSKNPIANINISLRDFLSTWNDEEEEAGERRSSNIEEISEHVERSIMREYNPMFVQKATENFMSPADVPTKALSDLDSGLISEGSEKLYVLESIDVPLSELNKYKHLSVINKLPENVVINDKELCADDGSMKFIEEIDLTHGKFYKSEFELEFEACQERKITKPIDEPSRPIVLSVEKIVDEVSVVEPEMETTRKLSDSEASPAKKRSLKVKSPKLKSPVEKVPKILKLKKEKILKASKEISKVRITKRIKKYSLNLKSGSVKNLQSLCVDVINTSTYRNHAREQLKIINKQSKMRILKDFKKKFNFDGIKRPNSAINQKFNHSVRINSLREICGKFLKDKSRLLEITDDDDNDSQHDNANCDFPTLKQLCKSALTEMDIDVVEDDYVVSPPTLKELCETFIYSNRQYFLIEEVSNVPKLQDLCKNVLSETNIFINLDEANNGIFSLGEPEDAATVDDNEPIYIVEESSGNVGELFESENLNSFERSEILRKIQRVASIEDDDEIIRAIGALHRDDEDESIIINNNDSNVSNRNISCADEANEFSVSNEEEKFAESEMSFLSYMDDDLLHAVQYEEIISGSDKVASKTLEILRHKYLNRADVRQATKTIKCIVRKSLTYQRVSRFRIAERRRQRRAALLPSNGDDHGRATSQHESEYESQQNAKEAQRHDYHRRAISDDDSSPVDDDVFESYSQAEHNFPKLPAVLPSINEYKIDRKSSDRGDVKDTYEAKRHKLTFDESLLKIDQKMYGRSSDDSRRHRHHSDRRHSSHRSSHHHSRRRSRSRDRGHRQSSHSRHHRSNRSRSPRKSYHNSSRHNNYKADQNKHSEAKRLVIPSYKLYDKDLDVKLKIMPFVRIEREEKVDDMVKKYN